MIGLSLKAKILGGGALAVFVAVSGILAAKELQVRALERDLAAAEHERDSLAIEAVAQRAELEGWSVRFAQMVASGTAELQGRDSMLAALGRDLEEANARVRQYVSALASAEEQIESLATGRDTISTVPRWWTGRFADGLLSADWRFERLPEANLSLGYRIEVPVELVTSEGGDGRWLVTGRSSDSRVRLDLDEVIVEPTTPEVVTRTSLRRQFIVGLISGVAGALGWEVIR